MTMRSGYRRKLGKSDSAAADVCMGGPVIYRETETEGREERTIIYMSELDRELELVNRRCDWLELIE